MQRAGFAKRKYGIVNEAIALQKSTPDEKINAHEERTKKWLEIATMRIVSDASMLGSSALCSRSKWICQNGRSARRRFPFSIFSTGRPKTFITFVPYDVQRILLSYSLRSICHVGICVCELVECRALATRTNFVMYVKSLQLKFRSCYMSTLWHPAAVSSQNQLRFPFFFLVVFTSFVALNFFSYCSIQPA